MVRVAEAVQVAGLLTLVAGLFLWVPVVGICALGAVLVLLGVAVDPRVGGRR